MTVAAVQPDSETRTPARGAHAHPVNIDKRWAGRILGAAIGVGVLYAVVTSAGGLGDAVRAVTRAQPDWIVLGLVCEAASFVLLGELLKRLIGGPISRHTAIDLGLVLAGLGGVLPAAPAEGLLMARAELRRRNVDNRRAPLALAYSQWYTTRAALGLIAANAVALAAIVQTHVGGRFARLWIVGIPAATLLMLLAFSAWLTNQRQTVEWVAIAIGKLRFWQRTPTEALRADGARWHADAQTLLGDRRNRWTVMTVALLSIGADVACFVCAIRSVGIQLRPGGFLLIYGAYVVFAGSLPSRRFGKRRSGRTCRTAPRRSSARHRTRRSTRVSRTRNDPARRNGSHLARAASTRPRSNGCRAMRQDARRRVRDRRRPRAPVARGTASMIRSRSLVPAPGHWTALAEFGTGTRHWRTPAQT